MATLAPHEKWHVEIDMDYVHQLRIALNLSAAELARGAGIDPSSFSLLGRNRNATFATVAKLATYLQVQPGELIIWYAVPKETPDVLARRRRPHEEEL